MRVRIKSPISLILQPFQEFAKLSASGGILLFLCTVAALVWANSAWSESYFALWHTRFTIAFGGFELSKPLELWINDGLMAIFFFVVGLEIKREVLTGELRTLREASLPVAAAVGGMIAPALIYISFNFGTDGARGWGIPMATDIAFSLGVLQLFGSRVPLGLKVFLTAFAIVDDIGAVLVIAMFYTDQIAMGPLGSAVMLLAFMFALNRAGVRSPIPYAVLGAVLWVAVLKSGIHATIAGVLAAMAIPAWSRINISRYLAEGRAVLDQYEGSGSSAGGEQMLTPRQMAAVHTLEQLSEGVQTPLQRLEHGLHPWVTFLILPVFALANAGVSLTGGGLGLLTHSVSIGIILGLVLGKLVGVTLFSWLAVRMGIAGLPPSVTWKQLFGAACLGGIGFTMSLFIANLAFGDSPLLAAAKIGILAASIIAGLLGAAILFFTGKPRHQAASR